MKNTNLLLAIYIIGLCAFISGVISNFFEIFRGGNEAMLVLSSLIFLTLLEFKPKKSNNSFNHVWLLKSTLSGALAAFLAIGLASIFSDSIPIHLVDLDFVMHVVAFFLFVAASIHMYLSKEMDQTFFKLTKRNYTVLLFFGTGIFILIQLFQ